MRKNEEKDKQDEQRECKTEIVKIMRNRDDRREQSIKYKERDR